MGEKTSTKENDGKGARRVLTRKLGVIIGIFLSIIAVLTLMKRGRQNGGAGGVLRKTPLAPSLPHDATAVAVESKKHDRIDVHQLSHTEKIDLILSASANLVQINVGGKMSSDSDSYRGVKGQFCPVDWTVHKKDPATVPMFRDVMAKSHCDENSFSMDLSSVVRLSREHDEKSRTVHAIPPTGFVFHESRCGSTLVANSLAAMDPDRNRVYSESGPPLEAMRSCGENAALCSMDKAAELLRDVVYMMGRTNSARENRLFFKIQSVGTRSLRVVRHAFPDTPWIFVYRDPVQVMMSHLDYSDKQKQNANCVRGKKNAPHDVKNILKKSGVEFRGVSAENYCAAHLEGLVESAVEQYKKGKGRFVDYEDLPDILMDDILPNHFNVPIGSGERERITKVCGVYSKGRGKKEGQEWVEDSERKEKRASQEIKDASEKIMMETYHYMKGL